MKKIIITIILSFSIFLIGCESSSTTTTDSLLSSTVTTKQDLNNFLISKNISYPDYDNNDFFYYSSVYIYLNYPLEDFDSLEEKKTFFESENQRVLNESNIILNTSHDSLYVSSYSKLVILTYKNKEKFLLDFEVFTNALKDGFVTTINFNLNTIGEFFSLHSNSTIDDLLDVTEKYVGTEILYEKIDHTLLIASHEEKYFKDLSTYIIENYNDYLLLYPGNLVGLNEEFFTDNILIYCGFGHSGSLSLDGRTNLLRVDENKIAVEIHGTAISNTMTEDFNITTYLIQADRSIYHPQLGVEINININFLNGFNTDRPFYNSIDEKN
ncbi:MAG: hypothetical protein PHF05_03570 [Candidatus Izemoplasmatales bacterium]|jgi:hypothetical protein|nr:hypothetical protein [Candidatus Izemoplasmatales bacterium]MDD4069511.1 hypothetical protein [Candidatus Izemoplasmatales bacterium]